MSVHAVAGPERRRALEELLGRSSLRGSGRLEIPAVREALGLPESPCRAWLGPERWLFGGAVLHWLRNLPEGEASGPCDYDIFFPSLAAFNRGVADLLAAGSTFSCFQIWGDRCPFCGAAGALEPRGAPQSRFVPLPKAGCRACESTGSIARWGSDLRLTSESLAASGLVSLDLLSPRGEVFQLAAIAFEPTLDRVAESADFSICQLGLDDRHLYFGRHTWTDLVRGGRLRAEYLNRGCYGRLRKYMNKGFSPYPGTLARMVGFHLYLRGRARLAGR